MEPDLESRRARVAKAWALGDEIVLIGAGDPIPIPGAGDQVYPFRSHPEHFYLSGREVAGGVLAFDPRSGWTEYAPEVTQRERVWEGAAEREGLPLALLAPWILERRGRPIAALGSELPGLRFDAARSADLRLKLTHARRPKEEAEIARIRDAVRATEAGYAALREAIRPGVTERAVRVELEAAFLRAGADAPAYHTIVGSGPNAAVLHFAPTDRRIGEGELVLVDAAAEVRRYCCDVTRTFPAGGEPTPRQRDLYRLVRDVEEHAIGRCVAGAEFVDVHLAACREVAEGLLALGLLQGVVDSLLERGAHEIFFPHGIGHMVGLGVRDASGSFPGRAPGRRPEAKILRMDLPLEPGYVLTIEPGVYFIPPLLHDRERRAALGDAVRWSALEPWMSEGGVRIEDNVLVTERGPEVLTAAIPR